jgi:hypothetical protein
MSEGSAEDLYQKRIVDRQCYLTEAERSAKVSIPSVIPDDQDICVRTTPVVLDKPFQSLGARGVNNLASKLLLTLLPPTLPFMKYVLSGKTKSEIADGGAEAVAEMSDIQARLARREARIQDEVDVQNIRTKAFSVFKHLLIAGNVLAFANPKNPGLQVFPLNSYVTSRDGAGNLLDLIYVEKLDRMSISDERVLAILASVPEATQSPTPGDGDRPVFLYTRVVREGDSYRSWQEVGGLVVPDSEETWTEKNLPWLALRYTSIDGEDYGRGFIEEYRGDLTSYEQLSRDTLFASANAAKLVWLIDPTSTLKPKKFLEAVNGGAVSGRQEDVTAARVDKGGDMNFVANEKRELQQALSSAFMLNSSFQRNQERVTAEEIRRMAEELEDTLGGVFSLLSTEFQLPLALLIESGLIKRDPTFKALPKDSVRVGVVTGLAAIGRGQELQRLRESLALVAEASAIMPGLVDYINEEDLNTRLWTGTGVDTEGLLKDAETVAQERQARSQAAAQQTLGQELARGAGNAAGGIDPETVVQSLNPQEQ